MAELAYIGLGSNLGDRQGYLQGALPLLHADTVRLVRASSVYCSAPVGPVRDQPAFFNAVLEVNTPRRPSVSRRTRL